jgi:hypothetical protein
MKTKVLLAATLIGAAALSAQAGVSFGFSLGLPVPVVVAPAPVVVAPAPVVAVPAPVVVAPAPAVVVGATVCPGPGYIWAPGFWSVNSCGRVWVPGGWRFGGGHGAYYGYGHAGWSHGGYGWHR